MMRWAAALVLLMSASSHARGDDAYPTQLVDRAPFLPAGTTEASGTVSLFSDYGVDNFTRFDLGARRSFGAIEPFVSILTNLENTAREDPIASVTGGAAVPLTRTSDLRASVRSIAPFDGAAKGYQAAIAYEGRYAVVPRVLAISGAIGGSILWAHREPSGIPPDLAAPVTTTNDLAFARGALEMQDTERFALWLGVELNVEHDHLVQATYDSTSNDHNAIYALGMTYATSRVDVVAQVLRSKTSFGTVFTFVTGVAARF